MRIDWSTFAHTAHWAGPRPLLLVSVDGYTYSRVSFPSATPRPERRHDRLEK